MPIKSTSISNNGLDSSKFSTRILFMYILLTNNKVKLLFILEIKKK